MCTETIEFVGTGTGAWYQVADASHDVVNLVYENSAGLRLAVQEADPTGSGLNGYLTPAQNTNYTQVSIIGAHTNVWAFLVSSSLRLTAIRGLASVE